MSAPFFSIVIPTFNRSALLPSTLESIWNQTFSDYEVIVVNDGSTDNSSEVLSKIQQAQPRLRIITQENAERGAARNKGWKEAVGQYVVFFDSDDLMHPKYLEVVQNTIADKNPDMVCGKLVFEMGNGNIQNHVDQKHLAGLYNYQLFLKGNPIACHFAVKNDLRQFKPFNEDRKLASMEDWLFLLENTLDKQIFIINQVLVTMRIHSEQSMKQDQVIIDRKIKAVDFIETYIKLSTRELQLLRGYSYENIGIHFANQADLKNTLSWFWKSFRLKGISMKMSYNLFRIAFVFIKNHSK